MRKRNYLFVFMAVIVFLAGCTVSGHPRAIRREGGKMVRLLLEENSTMETEPKKAAKKENGKTAGGEENYRITMEQYHIGDVDAMYPRIWGLWNRVRESKINRLIEYRVIGDIIGRPSMLQYAGNVGDFPIKLRCQVTFRSSGILSFYYVGETCFTENQPTDVFYSMTFDIKEAKELILSDLVDIDETLVDRIKNSTDITNQKLEENPDNETLRESLLAAIQEKDTLQYMEFLAEWEDRFVLEQNALIVTMEVSPDDGDYVLIRIPGQMEGNRFIFDEP